MLQYVIGPKGLHELASEQNMTSILSETLPKYKFTARSSESRADIESIGEYSPSTHASYMRLSQSRWARMRDMAGQISSSAEHQTLKSLASLAYEVRRSTSFRIMLEQLSRRGRGHVSKIVEKVGKLARFYRSAITFAHTAVEFGSNSDTFIVKAVTSRPQSVNILSSVTVDQLRRRLPPPSRKLESHAGDARRLLRRWKQYVVHAEMLLLLFYEEHPEISKVKDYIGISKRSCFLCANFIRFHKVFTVEGGHQQLYCLWTLPAFINFPNESQSKRFSNALKDLCSLVETKVAAICAFSYRPFPFHTESVANFSRLSLLKWPSALEKSRTTADFQLDALSSFASHSQLTKCEDVVGALQPSRAQVIAKADAIPSDQDFNRRFEDTIEVGATKLSPPQDEDKGADSDKSKEFSVLEPVPQDLEAPAVATEQQVRLQGRRNRRRHRSRYQHRSNQLSSNLRENARGKVTTRRQRADEPIRPRKSRRKAKVRQVNIQRNRNKAIHKSAGIAPSHGHTKPKLSRLDESKEVGCLQMAFSCLWTFRMLFQCIFQHIEET
ncbi:MAG: hypothetical protein AUG51_18320 [Acidobacteria bacterium 13_1_20CM_3_53_8]|nr:MAG: hypothetical protein AUG51_18320 [Acidobacteria bacterium 13_1_20CM_3_53_8]